MTKLLSEHQTIGYIPNELAFIRGAFKAAADAIRVVWSGLPQPGDT
jgi:hypothetical protein